jgi:hypothetical protein
MGLLIGLDTGAVLPLMRAATEARDTADQARIIHVIFQLRRHHRHADLR